MELSDIEINSGTTRCTEKGGLHSLYIGSVSACFELENELPYYAAGEYTVFLNGAAQYQTDRNVFSVFDLLPGQEYTVSVSCMVKPLWFRTKEESCCLNVREFGAKGDGIRDDSAAFRNAIACLPDYGRLYVPAGTYLLSPLWLKSRMILELAEGAVLLGSPIMGNYPVLPGEVTDPVTGETRQLGSWEGCAHPARQALLSAAYAEEVAIVGQGTVDGNGPAGPWWSREHLERTEIARPKLIELIGCKDVMLHGITARNSPAWHIHPYFSRQVGVYDIRVEAPRLSPNTDALDPESCDGVDIIGCRFSVGDDCIALKACKIELAKRYKAPAAHTVIRNCRMEYGHGAVTLGSEMACGVKDLSVSRCIFDHTERGLRIKTRRGRGKEAQVDGLNFENIRMDHVDTPIVINMWYNCCDPDRHSEYVWTREALPVDERTPRLGVFRFRDMICTDCRIAGCWCDGLPEAPIEEITLENMVFTFDPYAKPGKPACADHLTEMCRAGLVFDNVGKLTLRNVRVEGCIGAAVRAAHTGEICNVNE